MKYLFAVLLLLPTLTMADDALPKFDCVTVMDDLITLTHAQSCAHSNMERGLIRQFAHIIWSGPADGEAQCSTIAPQEMDRFYSQAEQRHEQLKAALENGRSTEKAAVCVQLRPKAFAIINDYRFNHRADRLYPAKFAAKVRKSILPRLEESVQDAYNSYFGPYASASRNESDVGTPQEQQADRQTREQMRELFRLLPLKKTK